MTPACETDVAAHGTACIDLNSTDPDDLRQYAIKLDGHPVPGVRMTAEEFEAWAVDRADAEWVDGRIILMAPASDVHEGTDEWLGRLVGEWVEHRGLGKVRRNMAVRLPMQRRRRVPDLMFVAAANVERIKPTYIDGPPDLVVEIVSPDSQDRDRREKYLEYEAGGVREYWIVDPLSKRVSLYQRGEAGTFLPAVERDGRLASVVLEGFYLRPTWLFEDRPTVREALAAIEAVATSTPAPAGQNAAQPSGPPGG